MGKKKIDETEVSTKKKSPLVAFLTNRKLGFLIAIIEVVISAYFIYVVANLGILPPKYMAILVIALVFFAFVVAITQYSKVTAHFFRIISLLLSGAMIASSVIYIGPFKELLNSISGADTIEITMSVYVLKDDEAESLSDLKDYAFSYLNVDINKSTKAIENINKQLDTEIDTTEYETLPDMVAALFDGDTDAIILNSAYVSILEDGQFDDDETYTEEMRSNFVNFSSLTKEVASITITESVTGNDTEYRSVYSDDEFLGSESISDITKKPFILYISGIDKYGSINVVSRSDVNILAVVNPKTKTILLINTPRDSYVYLKDSGTTKDKLTHAGIYGIDDSVWAMENLYGIYINYYLRLNFTGFQNIIDALGGITVNNDVEFTTYTGGIYFPVGNITMDGYTALKYCRERKSLAGGDRARGKHQMMVITATLNKLASSALLKNYSSVLESLSGAFQTSISSSEISALVNMQLDDMSSWNIQSYSVDGTGISAETYSIPGKSLYVLELDQTTIDQAREYIKMVLNGETLTID